MLLKHLRWGCVRVKIKTLNSLTVGLETSFGIVDVGFNQLGIPGSSIKGVMRTAITWTILTGQLNKFTACGEIEPSRISNAHMKGVCDVCKLFGYPDHAGKIVINTVEVKKKHVLRRVSINDETLTAKKNALFVQEVIKPGEEFEINIRLNSNSCRDMELLLYSLYYMRLWRLGRGGMIDLKVEQFDECVDGDGKDIETLKKVLSNWLWEDE
jgi:CRISPR/Cas system CSM-associated protein Csm3 (group 7 of RAMP superfamily)